MRGGSYRAVAEHAADLASRALLDTRAIVSALERLLEALPRERGEAGETAERRDLDASALKQLLEDLRMARRAADDSLRNAQEAGDRTLDELLEAERDARHATRAITGVIRRVPGRKTA